MGNLFLDKDHHYLLDGVRIPGVSEVLKEAKLIDFSDVNPELLERSIGFGNAVHAAINFKCKGTLDEDSVDEEVKKYVQSWDNFVEDFGYTCTKSEYQGYQPTYRYGFTADQQGVITKGDHKIRGFCIGDIKTGSPSPSHKYQLAGYKIAMGTMNNTFILYLNPNFEPRGYKVVFAPNNKREQAVFLAALSIYNVRKQEGLL